MLDQPPHFGLLITISLEPSAGSDGRGLTSARLWLLQWVINDNLISLRIALFNYYLKGDKDILRIMADIRNVHTRIQTIQATTYCSLIDD